MVETLGHCWSEGRLLVENGPLWHLPFNAPISNWTIPFLKLTYRQIDLNWSQHPTYQLYGWNPWNNPTETSLNAPRTTINTLYHHMIGAPFPPSHPLCRPQWTHGLGTRGDLGVGAWGGSHGVLHSSILLVVGHCQMTSDVFVYRLLGRLLLQQDPSYGWGNSVHYESAFPVGGLWSPLTTHGSLSF